MPARLLRPLLAALIAAVALCAGPSAAGAAPFRISALGDSVSSGFGYCGTGDTNCGDAQDVEMSLFRLPRCNGGETLDNRCSSNFGNPTGAGSSVAWSTQFANVRRAGLTNVAVQGARPVDWDTGGEVHGRLDQIVEANPDLVGMTLGANPILREFSLGGNLICTLLSNDRILRACLAEALQRNGTVRHLQSVYRELLTRTHAQLAVFRYHNPIPTPAVLPPLRHKVAIIITELNNAVTTAFNEVSPAFPGRMTLLTPDNSPWGFDHQCTPVQALLITEWLLTRGRSGLNPRHTGTPWVLTNDLCTHPTRAGYTQFADPLLRHFPTPAAHRARTAAEQPVEDATAPLQMKVQYRAVQVAHGRPTIKVRLSRPASLEIRTGHDVCLKVLVIHPACRAEGTSGQVRLAAVQRVDGKAGDQTIKLKVEDGFFLVSVDAKATDGTTAEDTLELIDQTRSQLMRRLRNGSKLGLELRRGRRGGIPREYADAVG